MGIRKRRRKLSTLVSRLDQRVRSVELRPINLLTADQVTAATTPTTDTTTPESFVGSSAPNQFVKVESAWVYPKGVVGTTKDRVEIFLQGDLQAAKGDKLEIRGIHGTSADNIDVDGDAFAVTSADTPPWDGRQTWRQDPTANQLPGVVITNAYTLIPETAAPTTWTAKRKLVVAQKIDSYSITGNTVTLTLNAAPKFVVDDIVYVNIFSKNSTAFGQDGIFKIASVSGNNLTYTLSAGVDTPTGTVDISADGLYVHAVARKYCAVGSTWTDSSTSTVYYWDGIRWVGWSSANLAPDDNDPPLPPTALSVSGVLTVIAGKYVSANVEVSWTAPTKTAANAELTDLVGYGIRWKKSTESKWPDFKQIIGSTEYKDDGASYTWEPSATYNFQVVAFDSGLNYSTALAGNYIMPAPTTVPLSSLTVTAPTTSIHLATVTLKWDGKMTNNQPAPSEGYILEIHRGLSSSFTCSSSTLIGTVNAVANAIFVDSTTTVGSTYYYKFRLQGLAAGSWSLESSAVAATTSSLVDAQKIASIIKSANVPTGTIVTGENIIGINVTGQLVQAVEINANIIKANSITANQMDVGNVTAVMVSGGYITTRTSGTSSGITLTSTGLTAYNGTTPTFSISSSNGAVTIGSGATIPDLSAVNTVAQAANTTANNANTTANAANTKATSANTLATSAQDSVDALKFSWGDTVDQTYIDGGMIYTGTISAESIGADAISTYLLNGRTIRVAASASSTQRVLINKNGIFGYDSAGDTNFRLYASNGVFYVDKATTTTINNSGYITGGVIRTGSGYPHVEMETANDSLKFRYTSTTGVSIGAASTHAALSGSLAISTLANPVNTASYYVLSESWTGKLLRGPVYSDERLKTNIEPIPLGLDFIDSITPVSYTWRKDSKNAPKLGVIAQDVLSALESHAPELTNVFVNSDSATPLPDGSPAYTMNYNSFIPVLLQSVKDLSAQVTSLREELEILKNK